jgi:hypothetical protein
MPQKLFISHSSKDKALAATLSEAIDYVSQRNLIGWVYSNKTAGSTWSNDIMVNLNTSRALVVLVTPNSVGNRWVHIEIGIAIAREMPIIPICLCLSEEDVPSPLNIYTCFPLNDYPSYLHFFSKVFDLFHIPFQEEMAKSTLIKVMDEFASACFPTPVDNKGKARE